MNVVISQSMYFPWVGLLEQLRLADVFVHYNDVQFTRGFYNRVQIKTSAGTTWLSVPTKDRHQGQKIDEVRIDDGQQWRRQHRELLHRAYAGAPFVAEMLALVDVVFDHPADTIADISLASMMSLADYFHLCGDRLFLDSRSLNIVGASSQRLLDITRKVGGDAYITGHGAKNYLDHQLFANSGIEVRYMNYLRMPYRQLHGMFTPYVSALDLVANCGVEGARYIRSETVSWQEFIA
jgi:hypothetical protein